MTTRPGTPEDALRVTTYAPGQKVYYALPGDSKRFDLVMSVEN